jgi:prepilin-type N-terminal cleavage/methylation domain-containing protein
MEGDMDKRGFSLMELNVCCVVIAILAAVSVPLLKDMRQAAVFRSEVRQLYSSLQQAKIEAIKQNSPVVFTLSPEGYTFLSIMARAAVAEATGYVRVAKKL